MEKCTCSKVEEITEMKASLRFLEDKVKGNGVEIKEVKENVQLYNDITNKLFSTKQENADLKQWMTDKHDINAEKLQDIIKEKNKLVRIVIGAVIVAILKTIGL